LPEKYASTTRPVRARTSGSSPSLRNRSQIGAVWRDCQTIARWIGSPLARSHTTVVSRWLVMPIATTSAAVAFALASTPRAARSWLSQISLGSCSTQPGFGKCWGNSCWSEATTAPSRSKRIARDEVVPWSSAST
jgi:hypothetical protein